MWSIFGLGNPGTQYQDTRHNVGFWVIDLLAQRWKISVNHSNSLFAFGTGDFRDIPVLLVKPMTYMNRSGDALRRLRKDEAFDLESSLIIYDDIHLPVGKLRLRPKGSHGGHNGMESIIQAAGNQNIPRVRIGVGEPDEAWQDYVLKPFRPKEREIIDESIVDAAECVESILLEGVEKAMNLYNR